MSNYTTDESMVRVDFFKPSGKWYTSEELKWIGYHGCIQDEFKESLKQFKGMFSGMTVVCLLPYNKCAYPLMTTME